MPTPDSVNADSPNVNYRPASFEPATIAEVRTISVSSASKCCDLNPLPTILRKACLDVLIISITYIIILESLGGMTLFRLGCPILMGKVKVRSRSKSKIIIIIILSNISRDVNVIFKCFQKLIYLRTHIFPWDDYIICINSK